MKDILEILEGNCALVDCVLDPVVCKRSATCVPRKMWRETSKQIADVLASVKLADLVAKAKKRAYNEELSYVI